VSETGLPSLRKIDERFGLEETLTAMRAAASSYLETEGDPPRITSDSWSVAFKKIGGICRTRRDEKDEPNLRSLYWIRGIMRKRWNYIKEHQVLDEMREALDSGVTLGQLEHIAKTTTHWTQWRGILDDLISEARAAAR
jgi:hypothetical protein